MSARNSWIVPFLLFSTVIGRAQQPSAIPDFAGGFKQLAALGMPPLDAQATWSVVAEAANNSNYQLREVTKSLRGNAWLLPLADDKSRAIGLGGVEVIELKAAKKHPAEPDLTKDTEAVIAGLKKLAAKMNATEDGDPFGSGSRYGGGQNGYGSLLLFAAQLQQTGHPVLANRLALAVFEVYPSREAAVDAAVDVLADHLYQQASRAFFASGDWPAYHTALVGLCKRFPRGWYSRDAVAMLLPQLEKQAAGSKAPDPNLPDIALDPRAIAIIRELTDKPPADPNQKPKDKKSANLSAAMRYRMQMSEGYGYDGEPSGPPPLWLISAADADADASDAPQFRLAALKMTAIPALAALTADPFLTHQPNAPSYSGYYSSGSSSEDRTLSLYASLNRPATRGEIATRLLAATLPEAQHESDPSQLDPEAIREAALAFWKEHKDATREELAAVFLRDGSSDQSSQAAAILAASTEPKAHQAFETHVLAADPAIASFQAVQTYLRSRRAAARPFFDAYAKLVRSQGSGGTEDSNPNAWAIKQAGGTEKILKQLETLVGDQSPRALAIQIAKGKPADAKAAIASLSTLLVDAPPVKHLHALLEGANAATDATVRARFLAAALGINWTTEAADEEPPDEATADAIQGEKAIKKVAPPPDRKVSDPEATVWRKLLADTRELPRKNWYDNGSVPIPPGLATVADLAAAAFENSISTHNYYAAWNAAPILGKSTCAVLIERASARLAGKPMPPLPDASTIGQQRLAEIVATAGKKPAAEIHPYLATLTPDERAAWRKWINHPEELAIPDAVKELQFTVVTKSSIISLDALDMPGAGNLNIGFKITADSLTKHIESLAPEIDKHSRTTLLMYPADFGPGLQISASVPPLPAPKKSKSTPSPDESGDDEMPIDNFPRYANFAQAIQILDANQAASAIATVGVFSQENRVNVQASWLIQNGKATVLPDNAKDDDAKDPLAAALKSMLESKDLQHFYLQIKLLSRADADKFKASRKERDSSADSDSSEEVLPPPDE